MLEGYRVKAKIAVGRFKWFCFRLFLFLLGVMVGVSFLIAYKAYGEAVEPITYVNVPLMVEKPAKVKFEAKNDVWETALFTAYSAGDGFTPSMTMASGKKVYIGAVACPRSIPLGTVIEVKDYGRLTCEDRMAKRLDGLFDIYMDDISEALKFGKKQMEYRMVDMSK